MTATSLHAAVSGWLLGPPSGANRRLLELVRHAAPLLHPGERITVLHRPGFSPPFALRAVDWVPVSMPRGPLPWRALHERLRLDALLRRLGATVCDHALLPAPRVRCPLLLTVHDLRLLHGFGRRPAWLARRALRAACARAATVLVPSAFTRTQLLAVEPRTAVAVVPNGVDVPSPTPPAASTDPPTVLHVGHLEPRKNLDVLLQALALLPAAGRPRLLLVGADAGAGPHLRTLAVRLGLAERVAFAGVVDEGALRAHYREAAAVAVPSRCEGFGLAALEGLAHGRPVLVAAAGALPEVVGDAGTVLPADDANAWARAIERCTDAAYDHAAAERRRARAAAFSWPTAAAQVVAHWRRLSAAR